MANTLTSLIPTIMEAMDIVARKQKGMIPAVSKDSDSERAALNQTIMSPVVPATTAEADNTPAVTAPDTGDQTIGNITMTISKSKHIPVRWNGEETRGLTNAGTYERINRDRFVQGFERLGNLIDIDLISTYANASRGYGTPGTTPFPTASDFTHFAGIRKIFDDNGLPAGSPLKLILNNAAMFNIRAKQSSLWKANEADSDTLLRDGILARVMGFDIGQSANYSVVTPGTASSATLTSTDYAVGSQTLTLASAGTGTIVAGDMVNIAGENNGIYYGVRSGDADVSNGGTFVLNNPGLQVAQTTNTSAITPAAAWTPNLAFTPEAIRLITRPPVMPMGGDAAADTQLITDPVSGITFEIALYKQFLQNVVHIRLAWGWKAIKEEFIAVLFG